MKSFSLDPELAELVGRFDNQSEAVRKGLYLLTGFDGKLDYPRADVTAMFADTVPVVLTGLPGSGKTTFLREKALPSNEPPVLVLDVHNEYPALKKLATRMRF